MTCIGAVALVGYLTGFEQAYGWGRFTKMSAQTAVGFLAVGSGVFMLGWREARAASTQTPHWLFAPITVGVAAISILFCQALINYEDHQIDFMSRSEAAAVQHEVESELEASMAIIEQSALRWGNNGRPSQVRWEANASLNFDGPTPYKAIEWVDPFYRTRWIVPLAANARDIGTDMRETPELLNTLAMARSRHETVISPPFDRGRGDLEIVVAHPVYVNNVFDGFIVGIFRVQDLFRMVLNENVAPTSSVAVYDGERLIFTA